MRIGAIKKEGGIYCHGVVHKIREGLQKGSPCVYRTGRDLNGLLETPYLSPH